MIKFKCLIRKCVNLRREIHVTERLSDDSNGWVNTSSRTICNDCGRSSDFEMKMQTILLVPAKYTKMDGGE